MSSMKVTLLASISADGFIAPKSEGSSLLWTSREDTRFFVQMSKEIGTLLMGSKHLIQSKKNISLLKIEQ